MNSTLVPRPPKYPQKWQFLTFQGVISCRIKPPKKFYSIPARVPVIFYWIYEGLCNSSFTEEIFNIEIWKKHPTWFFLQIYEPPDLGKEFFTIWNALKPEVYLTWINVWKFHVLKLLDSHVDLKIQNSVSKCNFLRFWPPGKSVFEIKINLKFSFTESGPGSVLILPKPIFLFKFSNF